MMNLAKLGSAVLVLLLAAVPISGRAQNSPDKLYALKITSSASYGDDLSLTAEFRNISPKNANSSFNALRLVAPDGVTILSAQPGCDVDTSSNRIITCNNLSPVGKSSAYYLNFTANVGPTSCGVQWNPGIDDDVWTGSAVGAGNPFALKISPTDFPSYTAALPSTIPKVVVSLTLQSGGAVIGSQVLGSATVTNSCGASAANVPVSTSITPDGSSISPLPGFTNASGVYPFSATFVSGTTGTVNITALGVTGTASVSLYPGTLACNKEILPETTNPDDKAIGEPGWSASERLLWNTNGAQCELVPYVYQNALLTNGSLVLKWPTQSTSTQKAALFRTSANGPAQLLPATTDPYPTPEQPLYAWEYNADGSPKYLTGALACLSNENPRPYARLATGGLPSNVAAGSNFDVEFSGTLVEPGTNTTDTNGWKTLPAAGVEFDVNIDDERVRVKVVSTNGTAATLQVVARQRGSTIVDNHSAGAFVIPTVMPIDGRQTTPVFQIVNNTITQTGTANPYFDRVVRMCTIAHGIQVYTPNATGSAQYFEFLEYFDGDGSLIFR
jgi:hypothetical protein